MTGSIANMTLTKSLDDLQKVIGDGNASRGFHSEGDILRARVAERTTHRDVLCTSVEGAKCGDCRMRESALRNYYMTKIGLIVTEAAEAIEELRNGHSASEQYTIEHLGPKPEGVPSEIADIVIRCFDFADEAGFSLGETILEKLRFNATRGTMHGGKTV